MSPTRREGLPTDLRLRKKLTHGQHAHLKQFPIKLACTKLVQPAAARLSPEQGGRRLLPHLQLLALPSCCWFCSALEVRAPDFKT